MDAQNTQPWYTSKGVWGSIAVIVVAAAAVFGVQLDVGAVIQEGLAIGTAVAGGIALYGRVVATKRISK